MLTCSANNTTDARGAIKVPNLMRCVTPWIFFARLGYSKLRATPSGNSRFPVPGASHTKISTIFSTDCNLSCSVSILSLVGQSCNCFIRENVYKGCKVHHDSAIHAAGRSCTEGGIFAFLQIVASLSHRRKIVSGTPQEQQSQTDWKQAIYLAGPMRVKDFNAPSCYRKLSPSHPPRSCCRSYESCRSDRERSRPQRQLKIISKRHD
jgi:hypothetical protein